MYPPSFFKDQPNDLNPDKWADEGAELAKNAVYEGIVQNTVESPQYRERRMNLALKQAALAGYRLAKVLDKLIK